MGAIELVDLIVRQIQVFRVPQTFELIPLQLLDLVIMEVQSFQLFQRGQRLRWQRGQSAYENEKLCRTIAQTDLRSRKTAL